VKFDTKIKDKLNYAQVIKYCLCVNNYKHGDDPNFRKIKKNLRYTEFNWISKIK